MKYFTNSPRIEKKDYILKNESWLNHESGEKRHIKRFCNEYDKGLLQKSPTDNYWFEIIANCGSVARKIADSGNFYYGFYSLPIDRSAFQDFQYSYQNHPRSLETVFVSGFLFPQQNIRKIQSGYYIYQGKEQQWPHIVQDLFPTKNSYPGLVCSFGYYYTRVLLEDLDYGYNQVRKRLGLNKELLSLESLPFLGSYFDSSTNMVSVCPSLFPRISVAMHANKLNFYDRQNLTHGIVTIYGKRIPFNQNQVDPQVIEDRELCIITPNFNQEEAIKFKDWKKYYYFMGEERINFLISNRGTGNSIKAHLELIKKGKVLLPPASFVVSLSEKYFHDIFDDQEIMFDADGYAKVKETAVSWDLPLPFRLLPYEEAQMTGDFLPLMLGKKDFTQNVAELETVMTTRGFFHPFSRQAQETSIEKPYAREPRAVLITVQDENGNEEYGYFSFSGRYEESIGISLFEIIPLLKKIIPSKKLMNVIHLDSGSAVKLFYFENSHRYKILNLPALSMRSFTGEYKKNLYSLMKFSL